MLTRKQMYLQTARDVSISAANRELAKYDHYSRQRVWRWRKDDPEFREAIDRIKEAEAFRAALAAGKPMGDVPLEVPDDFLRFRELVCAYKDLRWGRYVRATNNWYQRDAYAKLKEHNRLVVVLPPGHLKTTFFGIEYTTWRIMRDRDVRITVVQKNAEEAKKLVGAVQERLSDTDYYAFLQERLRAQYDPPIVNPLATWFRNLPFKPASKTMPENWGAYGFTVVGKSSGEKDFTMEAKGVGGQIQGVRADLILLDDIQDPTQAVKSPQDSKDKLRWFNDVILGRVADYQQVVVLANYFSPDDFAHLLIDDHPEFAVVEYPALIPGPDGDMVPLCPEYWTAPALEFKRREVGDQTWFYTWMQESGSFEEATFRRDILEAARSDDLRLGETPLAVTDIFMGVDPAISSSGHCAIVIWGLDRRTKQRYLIDVFNETGMRHWDNVIAQIVAFARAYRGRTCVIELANTQAALTMSPLLQREMRSLGWRIATYKTATGTGARAEQTNFDITTIGGLFDAGLITLPYGGTDEERRKVDAYIHQLCAWRTDPETGNSIKNLKRDMVMATLFAESEAFVLASRQASPRPRRRTRLLPSWATNGAGGDPWKKSTLDEAV